MTRILVSGCSYMAGQGLPMMHTDLDNFANIFIHGIFNDQNIQIKIDNIAVPGASNKDIFVDVLEKISKCAYDHVFVGWTSYPRHRIFLGVDSDRVVYKGHFFNPYNIGNHQAWKRFSKKKLEIANEILSSSHDHYEILEILRYSMILKNIVKNIHFINVKACWGEGYFERKTWSYPIELDDYTKNVLDWNDRSDDDIRELYNKLHRDYQNIIDPELFTKWLNLYTPMNNFRVDTGNDDQHPGPITHKKFANFLINQYKTISDLKQ